MFDFYLTIIKTLVKSEKNEFKNKFNSLVYADKGLSTDEKMFLLEEMQKEWMSRQERKAKKQAAQQEGDKQQNDKKENDTQKDNSEGNKGNDE